MYIFWLVLENEGKEREKRGNQKKLQNCFIYNKKSLVKCAFLDRVDKKEIKKEMKQTGRNSGVADNEQSIYIQESFGISTFHHL